MLPVSGAEQLNASGPITDRPMISQSGAYSRLVSPAPYSDSGSQRFQSPSARACPFSSSITSVGIHWLPLRRLSCTSAAKRASAGYTCASMKAPTRVCSRMTFSLCVNSMALSGLQTFDLAPGELGERPCAATHLERLAARRRARQRPRHDPLHDRRKPEHVERHVVFPVA